MKKLPFLILNDLKLIFRDNTLIFLLLLPFLLVLAFGTFIPWIISQYPTVKGYEAMLMMLGSIQTATAVGALTSFIMLEEKDDNVLQVIRVLPISPSYFIFYRMTFSTLVASLGAFMMMNLNRIAYPGFVNTLLLSLLCGLTTPILILSIVSFAKNKIEGVAFFKALNLLVFIPIAAFFLSGVFPYLFAVLPTYWTFKVYLLSCEGNTNVLYYCIAFAIHAVFILGLYQQFRVRVFER